MAWIKIPAEHHPIFREALPRDGRISVIRMFGALAALCNGNLFGGLFARSIIVRLSPEHYAEAMALDGTSVFDPMGNGRTMGRTLLLPEDVMEDPQEMRRWLDRAFRHTLTLPPKARTTKTEQKASAGPAKRATTKKPPVKKAAPAVKSKAKPRSDAKPKARAPAAKKRTATKNQAKARAPAARRRS
jgi:TfoX/Sxy family transcriptional regulator of competence genes